MTHTNRPTPGAVLEQETGLHTRPYRGTRMNKWTSSSDLWRCVWFILWKRSKWWCFLLRVEYLKTETKLHGLRPRDHRLSVKLVPNFADKGCHVVSVTNPLLTYSVAIFRPHTQLFSGSCSEGPVSQTEAANERCAYCLLHGMFLLDLDFSKMLAIFASETSIDFLQTTRHCIPEDGCFHCLFYMTSCNLTSIEGSCQYRNSASILLSESRQIKLFEMLSGGCMRY
jgi:hypothetical protein